MVTEISKWKKDTGPLPLEVPSGNTCLVRQKPLTACLKAGLVPNPMLALVKRSIQTGQGFETEDLSDDQILALITLIDNVVMACTVEPKVYPEPEQDGDRDDERLYVDEVSFPDKYAIYAYAISGVKEVAPFRGEQTGDVERIHDGEDIPVPAVSADGDQG